MTYVIVEENVIPSVHSSRGFWKGYYDKCDIVSTSGWSCLR